MELLKSLGFNVQVFVAQIILFLALLKAMDVLFWKPIMAHLNTRDQGIKDAYQEVEQIRHNMEALRADYQARIIQIEADARAHIQTAIKEAQAEREHIISEARAQSEATLKQGVLDLDREKTESLEAMRQQMTTLALTAVGKALGPVGDQYAIRRVVEESVARSAA